MADYSSFNANGNRFRDTILSRGNARDYTKMYRDFRGEDPTIEPILQHQRVGSSNGLKILTEHAQAHLLADEAANC